MEEVHIIGISGSLRKDSFNTKLLNEARELLPTGMTMEIISIEDIPLYNADHDLPAAEQRPAAVQQFRDQLAKAQGFLIASPEYNYSIPGGLKNAIDWASRGKDSPMMNKAMAIMGATPGMWGTVRMQIAFKPILQFLNITAVQKPEILISQADKKFNADGKLTDEKARELITQLLNELKSIIIKLKG